MKCFQLLHQCQIIRVESHDTLAYKIFVSGRVGIELRNPVDVHRVRRHQHPHAFCVKIRDGLEMIGQVLVDGGRPIGHVRTGGWPQVRATEIIEHITDKIRITNPDNEQTVRSVGGGGKFGDIGGQKAAPLAIKRQVIARIVPRVGRQRVRTKPLPLSQNFYPGAAVVISLAIIPVRLAAGRVIGRGRGNGIAENINGRKCGGCRGTQATNR